MFSLISSSDERKTRIEAQEFEKNRVESIETAITNQGQSVNDDEEGFELFRAQLHANDASENLDDLSQDEILQRYEEQLEIDRVKWRAYKANPVVQFARETPEFALTQKNIKLLDGYLAARGIDRTATLEQIRDAYQDLKARGQLDLAKASKPVDLYSIPMDELKELSGGSAEKVIVDYIPDPNVAYRHPGYV